jgi:MFS family permease
MVAIVVAAGTIGGPLVGGFVTDGLGWRWAFLINLPLGILTLIWVALMLRIPVVRRRARIDWLGAGLLAVAISAIVLLTTWAGAEFAWLSAPAFGLIALALVALAAFIWHERRSPEPILPLGMFANRSFTMVSIIAFITGAVVFACVLYLPLFQQSVRGASASASGLLLLPMMIPVVIVSQIAGRRMTATGRYKIYPIVGAIALTIGGMLLATMTVSTPAFVTALFMVFMGIGSGLTQQMTTTIAQNSVEQKDIGAASGAVTLLRTVGGSIGVAIFGTIYATHTNGLTGVSLHEGVASAISSIFIIVAIVSALGVLAACAITEVPLRTRATAPAAPAQPAAAHAPAPAPAPAPDAAR